MLCRGNGFYPGTGEVYDAGKGLGKGFNLNIPWQRGGLADADYIAAFDLVDSDPGISPVLMDTIPYFYCTACMACGQP